MTPAPERVAFRMKQGGLEEGSREELANNMGDKERANAELALAQQRYEEVSRLDPKSVEAHKGVRDVRALREARPD